MAEESNLVHALEVARASGLWQQVIGVMQGLRLLYPYTGRWATWARLVDQLTPELVDPITDGPLPGREHQWGEFTAYRVGLAERGRDWPTAIRLLQGRVAFDRQRAELVLAVDPANLDIDQRYRIRTLAVSTHELGELLREQQQPECETAYIEALELVQRIGDEQAEATTAHNLASAYLDVPQLRNLDQAERWERHALNHYHPADKLGPARSMNQLSSIHAARFDEAQATGRSKAELLGHLNAALDVSQQALDSCAPDAVSDLAKIHTQLGAVYRRAGDVDTAMKHYRESIRYDEAAGNRLNAAQTRKNTAVLLATNLRTDEALLWAQAALAGFQEGGPDSEIARAKELIALIQHLAATIERAKASSKPPLT